MAQPGKVATNLMLLNTRKIASTTRNYIFSLFNSDSKSHMELVATILDSGEQESNGVAPVCISIGSEQRIRHS